MHSDRAPFPPGRLGVWGHPWHGQCVDGFLTLPNAEVIEYSPPGGGSTHILALPGVTPGPIERTDEEDARDAGLGHQWLNYVMMSGDTGRQIYNTGLQAGEWDALWIYTGSDGRHWVGGLKLLADNTLTILLLTEFGRFPYDDTVSVERELYSAVFAPPAGARGSTWLEPAWPDVCQSPDGSKLAILQRTDQGIERVIEITIAGTEPESITATPANIWTPAQCYVQTTDENDGTNTDTGATITYTGTDSETETYCGAAHRITDHAIDRDMSATAYEAHATETVGDVLGVLGWVDPNLNGFGTYYDDAITTELISGFYDNDGVFVGIERKQTDRTQLDLALPNSLTLLESCIWEAQWGAEPGCSWTVIQAAAESEKDLAYDSQKTLSDKTTIEILFGGASVWSRTWTMERTLSQKTTDVWSWSKSYALSGLDPFGAVDVTDNDTFEKQLLGGTPDLDSRTYESTATRRLLVDGEEVPGSMVSVVESEVLTGPSFPAPTINWEYVGGVSNDAGSAGRHNNRLVEILDSGATITDVVSADGATALAAGEEYASAHPVTGEIAKSNAGICWV